MSGVIVGGLVTTRAGGYNAREAQKLQCILGACAVACAVPIPFFTEFAVPAVLFWLVLFFGGAVLPPVTGIMLNSVNELHRTSANAVANLAYNLLGYLPAPSFYGMVAAMANGELGADDATGGDKQAAGRPPACVAQHNCTRLPMTLLLSTTLVSISFLLWAIKLKLEKDDRIESFT